jgi:hypothetical protein
MEPQTTISDVEPQDPYAGQPYQTIPRQSMEGLGIGINTETWLRCHKNHNIPLRQAAEVLEIPLSVHPYGYDSCFVADKLRDPAINIPKLYALAENEHYHILTMAIEEMAVPEYHRWYFRLIPHGEPIKPCEPPNRGWAPTDAEWKVIMQRMTEPIHPHVQFHALTRDEQKEIKRRDRRERKARRREKLSGFNHRGKTKRVRSGTELSGTKNQRSRTGPGDTVSAEQMRSVRGSVRAAVETKLAQPDVKVVRIFINGTSNVTVEFLVHRSAPEGCFRVHVQDRTMLILERAELYDVIREELGL